MRQRTGRAGGTRVAGVGLALCLVVWLAGGAVAPAAALAWGAPASDSVPGGAASGDSVPQLEETRALPIVVAAEAVTEGAWAEGGGVLQVVTVALEPELPAGFRGHVQVQAKWGHEGVPVPSLQGLSSLDAEDFRGLGEAWLEWRRGDAVRVKAGWVDANSEFAAADAAVGFANPSFGLSPLLGLLPSYPSPAPSANLFVRPWTAGPSAGAGAYRRADGSWVAVAELNGAVPRLPWVRWSAGWVDHLGAGPAGADPGVGYLIVERAVEGSAAPFLMVVGSGDGPRHVAGGVALPFPNAPLAAEAGVGASGLIGGGPGEALAETYLAVRPVSWLRLQADGQLLLTRGERRAFGVLVRVAVTY